jgi:MoxR-like ATPase
VTTYTSDLAPQPETPLKYRRIFAPETVDVRGAMDASERDDFSVYVFDDETLILAVNVAIATRRCLLVFGPPGSGKSTLAANVARILGVPYFAQTITSRVQAQDLLWQTDFVRRLNDAQVHQLKPDEQYREIGVLWRAFLEGRPKDGAEGSMQAPDHPRTSCVVLLDEIDKAEADVTDGLLVPLDTRSFRGPDGEDVHVQGDDPLIVMTSNNERELSKPFLRRCIVVTLRAPTMYHLIKVAAAKLGPHDEDLYEAVAELFVQARAKAQAASTHVPNTAEFLDAVRSCREMNIAPGTLEWKSLQRLVLAKKPLAEEPLTKGPIGS